MAKQQSKSLAAAVGAAFLATAAIAPVASAAENPFQMNQLSAGYQVADGHEGKCGEGKCGDKGEGEGKCGEGKCGEEKGESEGKCGEGKCGEAG